MSLKFYGSTTWKRRRRQILRRDENMCQYFKRYGRRIDADTVHHIYPLEDYPQYALCGWNLISMSNEAHNKMHDRTTRKLTAEGEKLRARTIPPHPLANTP